MYQGISKKVDKPSDWVLSKRAKTIEIFEYAETPKDLNKTIKHSHYRTLTMKEASHKFAKFL